GHEDQDASASLMPEAGSHRSEMDVVSGLDLRKSLHGHRVSAVALRGGGGALAGPNLRLEGIAYQMPGSRCRRAHGGLEGILVRIRTRPDIEEYEGGLLPGSLQLADHQSVAPGR